MEHGGTSISPCDQTLMDGTIHKKPQRQMPLSGRSGEAQTQLWKEQKWKAPPKKVNKQQQQ